MSTAVLEARVGGVRYANRIELTATFGLEQAKTAWLDELSKVAGLPDEGTLRTYTV